MINEKELKRIEKMIEEIELNKGEPQRGLKLNGLINYRRSLLK